MRRLTLPVATLAAVLLLVPAGGASGVEVAHSTRMDGACPEPQLEIYGPAIHLFSRYCEFGFSPQTLSATGPVRVTVLYDQDQSLGFEPCAKFVFTRGIVGETVPPLDCHRANVLYASSGDMWMEPGHVFGHYWDGPCCWGVDVYSVTIVML